MKLPKIKHLLIIILIFSAITRVYRLDFPNKYVFDEVYHAYTAKEYLKGNKDAWSPWGKSPPGVANEWTHPPLAKEIMAASMFLVQSTDAWAWRLPGALFGILNVYLIFLLGIKLLKNEVAALIAAFIFSIDGLNFVQSRVGMNDIYYITFILLSLLLLLNKRFILSALFLGLALSSKWATLYAYLIILPLLLRERRLLIISYFLAIPALIYLASYIPFFLLGNTPDQFIELQRQMWWYHTNLKATHGYSSPWWSWPLNLYPVWYFVDYQKDKIANIFGSGNPAVFWVGSAAILLTGWEALKKKSFNLFVVVLGFLVFWLPWAFSPRIMFLYHFSPSVPFLSLALGYQLSLGLKDKQTRRLSVLLLILMTLSFALIFPFLTGIPIPKNFINLFFLTNISKNPF